MAPRGKDRSLLRGYVPTEEARKREVNIRRQSFVCCELKTSVRANLEWTARVGAGLFNLKDQFETICPSVPGYQELDFGSSCAVLSQFYRLPVFGKLPQRKLGLVFPFLRCLRNGLEHRTHQPLFQTFNDTVQGFGAKTKVLRVRLAANDEEAWDMIRGVLKLGVAVDLPDL